MSLLRAPGRSTNTNPNVALLVLALGLGWSSGAWAQSSGKASDTATDKAPSAAAKNEARERFDRGVHLFEKGENDSALAEFKRANDLVPNPLVLYNMGLVYAAMNKPVEAVDALTGFLSQATSAQRAQRRHAEDVRKEQVTRIAHLTVRTGVPASVEVDGVEVAHTPLTEPIRVASGAHVVGAQAPGYLPTRREVTLAGQVTQTIDLQLQPAESRLAQLTVTSSPDGAEILVNGQSVGVTPLPASVSVAPGSVKVEARRAGYLAMERTLTLGDGARGEVTFALQEDPAAPSGTKSMLKIVASEPGVTVAVDGRERANPGAGVLLPEGRHHLRVTLPGFEPYEKLINLPAGSETPLAVVLVPTSETRARYQSALRTRRIVGWSLLGLGVAMVAGGTTYGLTRFGEVSDSRDYLNQVLANEADRNNTCYAGQGATYQIKGCDAIKADAQSRVDSAVLKRNLGFVGAGVGAAAAVVGGYLLLSGGDPDRYKDRVALSNTFVWVGQGAAGMTLVGRF
jgi:tetratricopeptide (TPR) repeat protein